MLFNTLIGILIPFVGTSIGAFCVFFIKKDIGKRFECLISGFAGGVMIAASVWSLLIPAMEYKSSKALGTFAFVPAVLGLWCGIIFLIFCEKALLKIDENSLILKAKRSFGENSMLFFSVTLHNLPEGMAIGVVYAAYLASPSGDSLAGALALAIGIAIQNIPEGAIISIPLCTAQRSRFSSFLWGMSSGFVEPIGAILTLLAISIVLPILPYLLGFAAGTMIYAVIRELMPSFCNKNSLCGVLSFGAGFCSMMVLDVVFG